jgi:hypothetical protein
MKHAGQVDGSFVRERLTAVFRAMGRGRSG